MWSYFFSYIKGLCLGGAMCVASYVMDYTVSYKSQQAILKEKTDSFAQAHQYIVHNLIGISPIAYLVVDKCFLSPNQSFSIFHYMCLLLTQNLGYFFVHREMHRNMSLYGYHKFHHTFDHILAPSIGFAVSHVEFCVAYMAPFIMGAFIFRPSEASFLAAIGTVGVGNLLIHTYELKDVPWMPGLISPNKHITHHEIRNKHYAAPIFDFDAALDYVIVDL